MAIEAFLNNFLAMKEPGHHDVSSDIAKTTPTALAELDGNVATYQFIAGVSSSCPPVTKGKPLYSFDGYNAR
jgi:hypothetical protein